MLRTDWQPSPERRRSLERLTEVLGEDWQSLPARETELAEVVAQTVAAVVLEEEEKTSQTDQVNEKPLPKAVATPAPSAPPGLSKPSSRAPSPPPTEVLPASNVVIPGIPRPTTPPPPTPVTPCKSHSTPKVTTISSRPSATPVSTPSGDKPKSTIFLPLASDRELVVEPSRSTKAKLKKAEKEKAKLEKERIKLEQVKAELEIEKEKLRAANLEKARLEKEIRTRLEREREEKERAVIERERELTAMLKEKEKEDKPVEKIVKGKKGTPAAAVAVQQPSNKALRAAVKAGMAAAFAPASSATPSSSALPSIKPSPAHSKSSSTTKIDIPLGNFPALSGSSFTPKTPLKSMMASTSVTTTIGKGGKPTLIPTLSSSEQAPVMGRMTKKAKGPKVQTPKKVVPEKEKVKKEEPAVVVGGSADKKEEEKVSFSRPEAKAVVVPKDQESIAIPSSAPSQPIAKPTPPTRSAAASTASVSARAVASHYPISADISSLPAAQSEDEWSSSASSVSSSDSETLNSRLFPPSAPAPLIPREHAIAASGGADALRVREASRKLDRAKGEEEEESDPYSLPAMLDSIAQVMDCSTLAFFEPLPSYSSPSALLPLTSSTSSPSPSNQSDGPGPSFAVPLSQTHTPSSTTNPPSQILDAQTLALALSALSSHHPTITMEQAVSSFHQLLTLLTDKITSVLGVLPRDREIEGGVASRFSEMFGEVSPSSSSSTSISHHSSSSSAAAMRERERGGVAPPLDMSARPRGSGGGRLGDGFDELDDELDEFGRTGEFGPAGGTVDEVERLKRALIRRAGYLAKQLCKLESLHTEINQVRSRLPFLFLSIIFFSKGKMLIRFGSLSLVVGRSLSTLSSPTTPSTTSPLRSPSPSLSPLPILLPPPTFPSIATPHVNPLCPALLPSAPRRRRLQGWRMERVGSRKRRRLS
jgi:hypothetical protein